MHIDKDKLEKAKNKFRDLLRRHGDQTATQVFNNFKEQLTKTIKVFGEDNIGHLPGLHVQVADTFYLWWLILCRDFPSFAFEKPKDIYHKNFYLEIKLYCLESFREQDVAELMTNVWIMAESSTGSVLKELSIET